MLQDTEVDSEGEIVQCAMLVYFEPVGIEEAPKKESMAKFHERRT